MFKLQNSLDETGEFAFSGVPIVSHKVSFMLSQSQIRWIIQTVKEYTKDELRPGSLIFEDDKTGDRIYVDDHISLKDMDELRVEDPNSFFLNYYTILYEGELPIA